MTSMTAAKTICHLRSILARHKMPREIITDNETQLFSHDFEIFTRSNNIKHTTSSLLFPQSNGMAEQSVQMAKSLVSSSADPCAALLAYHTTLLENGYSPAQLLYSRELHTNSPTTS